MLALQGSRYASRYAPLTPSAPPASARSHSMRQTDHNNTIHDVTRSVRYKGFKLRFNRDTGEAVLHDLSSDPGELEDASANFVSGREQLMKELVAFMEKPERETPTITLTPEELERLKSLGYIQ